MQSNFAKAAYIKNAHDPEVVGALTFSDISFSLTSLLKKFEPYGQGNPRPKFITENVEILQADTMGKNAEHLRFSFVHEGTVMQGVKFKTKEIFEVGSKVDISYTVNENHFRGKINLQLMVDKIKINTD